MPSASATTVPPRWIGTTDGTKSRKLLLRAGMLTNVMLGVCLSNCLLKVSFDMLTCMCRQRCVPSSIQNRLTDESQRPRLDHGRQPRHHHDHEPITATNRQSQLDTNKSRLQPKSRRQHLRNHHPHARRALVSPLPLHKAARCFFHQRLGISVQGYGSWRASSCSVWVKVRGSVFKFTPREEDGDTLPFRRRLILHC